MRYYSTQRPIGPGDVPKTARECSQGSFQLRQQDLLRGGGPGGLGLHRVRTAHRPQAAADYFLVADGVGCTGCVHEAASRDMDCCWNCSRNPRRKPRDLYRHRRAGGK